MHLYHNPIKRAGDFADPFVLRHDGRYYLYCTNPDVRCWSSSDLLDWQLEGPTIANDVFPGLVPFAPEVVYADGWFYMYTSPSGHGHVVLRSDSPTGPFVPISGNVAHAIDGNVLIDDDGTWYFYWAGDEGIWGCVMPSPTEFGEAVFTGIHMNGWTEGPFVAKRNGVYHMTLTGNHYLSLGYRIDAAWSADPLRGYVPDPLNPILISTDGPTVGLGHSSSVTGPDLVSTYLIYHDIKPDASRDLDIDRQVWNGRALQVLGPTTSAPAPAAPDVSCDWSAGGAAAWTVAVGELVARDGAGVLSGENACARWDASTGEVFTAELNLKGDSGHDHGIVIGERRISLPSDRASGALHRWSVEADDGLRVLVDGRFVASLPRGEARHVGVFAESGSLRIGHAALTRTVATRADRAAPKPVPGRFWATFGEGAQIVPAGESDYETVRFAPGATLDYELHVQSRGTHRVYLAGEFSDGDELALAAGGPEQAVRPCGGLAAATVELEEGARLRLRGVRGAPLLTLITVAPVPADGSLIVSGEVLEGVGKRLLDEGFWEDFDLAATLSVSFHDGNSHADLLLRASQLAEGGEGNDTHLGIDFLLGYSVQLHRDRVVFARHAYDEHVLATHPISIDPAGSHSVRLRARGGAISVELDGRTLFDVHDVLPYPAGHVGFRTSNARLHVELLELSAEGQPPSSS
ncbi:glycoside hydrolase family 43 protein [Microcella indica]|uniref:glycoside hydrolase family 43 protein n=1 Tax=Microcella indica TaxID=2750620 RepID=UPI0015CF1BC1|nr:glycoside hydrolase family 43 protein [Microcella indica]